MSQHPFIDFFRQSSPYIHAHRGASFVVLFGGEILDAQTGDVGVGEALLHDLALLNSLGVQLVLVHGARPQIDAQCALANTQSRIVEGLRVTDDASLESVKAAVGRLRIEIEALLSVGVANSPGTGAGNSGAHRPYTRVASGNFVTAQPLGVRDGVDYCHTGEVRRVDGAAIADRLQQGDIVLLSPMGYSPSGEAFNLSAEDVATAVAIELQADKLLILTEQGLSETVPDPAEESGDDSSPLSQLGLDEAEQWIDQHRPELPLATAIHAAVHACRHGVARAHLIDRHINGGLLQELFTRDGLGTLISAGRFEAIRPASVDDVAGILALIEPMEQSGALVRRPREQLELEIDCYTVIERDGMIIGCAALHSFVEDGVGELACLAVHPDYRRDRRGEDLLAEIEAQAIAQRLSNLFVLTTQTAHWFRERGFVAATLKSLPVHRQAMYNYQRNSKVFAKSLIRHG